MSLLHALCAGDAALRRLEEVVYREGEAIIRQGEMGADLFILDEGEAFAQIKVGNEWKVVSWVACLTASDAYCSIALVIERNFQVSTECCGLSEVFW